MLAGDIVTDNSNPRHGHREAPALIEELETLLGRGRIAVLYSPPPTSDAAPYLHSLLVGSQPATVGVPSTLNLSSSVRSRASRSVRRSNSMTGRIICSSRASSARRR